MRLSVAARAARLLSAAGLAVAVLAPAAGPAVAADPLVLKAGMLQKIDSLNPYGTALVSGYEAYELTYDQLVGFGRNLEPVPAFASSWSRSPDGKSVIFKFRPDLKWSDGQPANAFDACFSWQINLDAIAKGENVGLGYLDPSLTDAGVTKVECPDAETMIVSTEDQSDRVYQSYIPILPKHIWGKMDYKAIGDAKFEPPADGSGLVGTGPYQLVEYKQDQFARFVRNPNYWGPHGAADEVILQIFGTNDTMVQALKKGEIDYARNVSADQLKALKNEPNIVGVNGASNGWTELGFNTYGTGTGKTIKGGGPSTKALLDPAFRDALGYAIDKQKLIDNVLGGYGTIGSTQVPPVLAKWHVDPKNPRTFDIELAKQKLDAAGYKLDASGNRLDKEGKPINLRLVMPDDNPNHPKEGQFIQDWFGQLGIKVAPKVYDVGALVDVMLPPEAGGASNKADYDLFIWTWSGSPDPNTLDQVFMCDQIGSSSDSNWCNPEYDKLYAAQNVAKTDEERHAILDQMQQLWYDQAPYHILYYDDGLHAYRTDKFGGWQNQPPNGTPLFTYGVIDYPLLTDATLQPSPTAAPAGPSASAATGGATTAPAAGSPTTPASDSTSTILLVIAAVVVIAAVGLVLVRRRSAGPKEEE